MKHDQDIILERSTNLTVNIYVLDEDGDAKDVTGASFTAKFRDSDGTLKLTKSSSNAAQINIITAASGHVRLYFKVADTSDTDDMPAADYPYQLDMTLDSLTAPIAEGVLILRENEAR